LACERATDAQVTELLDFVDRCKDEPEEDSKALRFLKLDEEFHERLAALTGNVEITATLRNLNSRIYFVRWIDMQKGKRGTMQEEHRGVVLALQRRDADVAAQLVASHISRRLDQIVEVVKAGFAEIYLADDSSWPLNEERSTRS
jgi:DNA-binding GntR family transcriptional regulator